MWNKWINDHDSTDEKPKSIVPCTRDFSRFWESDRRLLGILIGSSHCLLLLWLVGVFTWYRGFARQPYCMAARTMKIICIRKNICSHGKKIYCSCHAMWLPCKTSSGFSTVSEWVSATIEPSIGTLPISIRCSPIFETSPERDFSLGYFTEMLFSYIFGPSVVK